MRKNHQIDQEVGGRTESVNYRGDERARKSRSVDTKGTSGPLWGDL